MLTSLKIENFKCFRQLTIEPLAKVNLIVGTSNSGKTAVLEALYLLPHDGGFRMPSFRDQAAEPGRGQENAKWLFNDLNGNRPIRITGLRDNGPLISEIGAPRVSGEGVLREDVGRLGDEYMVFWHPQRKLWTSKTIALSTARKPAPELARDFDRWTRVPEHEDRFVQFLQSVDPRLKSLRPMEHTGTRMLYADVRLPERIALPLLGDGFNRLVQVYGSIIGEGADVLLIDEIENGLHWSALPQIWTGIREAVNQEAVQIFATTHSRECIEAAVEVFKGEPKNDLAVHRLEQRADGEIHCVTMGEDELERMFERGWEVR
jgi:hypothetical protein